jgi:hypothetical protein
VAVRGLAPGRQVRCGFCHRLLEVPFLPRTTEVTWKRRRFGRPKWVPWAWAGLGIVAALVLVLGAGRVLSNYRLSSQQRSIHRLIESSRRNETSGRLSEALIDLDAALDIARNATPPDHRVVQEQGARRRELARRDLQEVLDGLRRRDSDSFPLGGWLDLIARSEKDHDLNASVESIKREFAALLRRQTDAELATARRLFDSGDAAESLAVCDRIALSIKHFPVSERDAIWSKSEALARSLIARYGATIETPRGVFVLGSQESYVAGLLPLMVTALATKGYLPYREASPWRKGWEHASYRLQLEITERLQGNYLSSENRMTQIEAHLKLVLGGKVVWQSTPTARTTVPLPNLSALASSRIAVGGQRSDEVEQLLYKDARDQIDGKVGFFLRTMPVWPGTNSSMHP